VVPYIEDRQAVNDTLHALLNIVGVLFILLTLSATLIWLERRLLAAWQDRYDPNRVGPFGLMQVLADMIKILTKEDWIPPFADKPVFILAPAVIMVATLLSFAVVPFAPGIGIVDLNIGILFFLAMSSMTVYSTMLAGWASNNKYALLGGLRAAAQMVSYEVFMGLSLMGVVIQAGSFNLRDIIEAQRHLWFCVPQILGLGIFFIAGLAETHRLPFDLPEAESELIAGFHAEYSGMKFGMFFVGEYLGIILIGGAALAGLPLLTAGFYSKDWILWQAWAGTAGSPWLWVAGLLGTLLTSVYIFRVVFRVFYGPVMTPVSEKPGFRMQLALLTLAVLSVVGGWLELPQSLGHLPLFSGFLQTALPVSPTVHTEIGTEGTLQLIASGASVLGIALAYVVFLQRPHMVEGLTQTPWGTAIHSWWLGGWGFDRLYSRLVVEPFIWLAQINKDDAIDAVYHGIVRLHRIAHHRLRQTQTGKVRWYAAGIAAGSIVIIALAVWL
jgi:NADH-quinone oxidoreductase subunit H